MWHLSIVFNIETFRTSGFPERKNLKTCNTGYLKNSLYQKFWYKSRCNFICLQYPYNCSLRLSFQNIIFCVILETQLARSSRPRLISKSCVLKIFAKFSGKYFLLGLQLYWKETLAQVFTCQFCKIFKNSFLILWLLLVTAG